jgi:hypothetical protein
MTDREMMLVPARQMEYGMIRSRNAETCHPWATRQSSPNIVPATERVVSHDRRIEGGEDAFESEEKGEAWMDSA